MKKIYIAILNGGWLRPELSNAITYISHDSRYHVTITYPNDKPTENNRNKIVQKFLNGKWDFLLMLDNDTVPVNNPLDLVRYNKDIIGYPYPQWNEGDLYWIVMDRVINGYKPIPVKRRNGLQQVDAIGTGCILIRRNVLERTKSPFTCKWSENGILELSEDFYFCQKAKRNGFEIWIDWNHICNHFKELNLIDVLKLLSI